MPQNPSNPNTPATSNEDVPADRALRQRLRDAADRYVREHELTPPMTAEQLRTRADAIIETVGASKKSRDYVAILIHNEVWREPVSAVPFDRRLLLLPKCLRDSGHCPATFDRFGLLCEGCGQCAISPLLKEAECLGYAVLVAEGSAVVTNIIKTGQIDAIIGVSCMSALREAFTHMENAVIPGLAIPLLRDGCKDTAVDIDWVENAIRFTGTKQTAHLNLTELKDEVAGWFKPDALEDRLGTAHEETERIARDWLSAHGKRWRPLLVVCTYKAIRPDKPLMPALRDIALAVECFHKASLIHDDIEDGDSKRYGQPTLHERYGTPVAINVGDFLIGEGYRLIAESDLPADRKNEMLKIAARGHRQLSLGQGGELCWTRDPGPLLPKQVIEIFRHKTAPAFEVAIKLGALCADADEKTLAICGKYSQSLGIAYQIRDDLNDWRDRTDPSDLSATRPSLLLALADECADGEARTLIAAAWRRSPFDIDRLVDILNGLNVEQRAQELLDTHKQAAVRCLQELDNPTLQSLLRRIVAWIFNNLEIKGWCSEPETEHAKHGSQGAESPA